MEPSGRFKARSVVDKQTWLELIFHDISIAVKFIKYLKTAKLDFVLRFRWNTVDN